MQEIDVQETVDQINIETGMQGSGRASMAFPTNEVSKARNGPNSWSNETEFTDGMNVWNRVRVAGH